MPLHGNRKKPFSVKQKKRQLQDKRERKKVKENEGGWGGCHLHPRNTTGEAESPTEEAQQLDIKRINQQPVAAASQQYNPNRFKLHFLRESKCELMKRKEQAHQTIHNLPEEALEIDANGFYLNDTELGMPKRPTWDYSTTPVALQRQEEQYFKDYASQLIKTYGEGDLSYVELNLETWRQLWRVIEMADIVLLITDIRHPVLHFSPAFYHYVTEEIRKPLILVLNKIDLVQPALVTAWKGYFKEKFPDIHLVMFTSFPRDMVSDNTSCMDRGTTIQKKRRRGTYSSLGPQQLLETCVEIVNGRVDLSDWRAKLEGEVLDDEASTQVEDEDTMFQQHQAYHNGVLTIGCCGYPNVGKSTLMNGLVGHKVVSVSKTPGHTKHFQTIYLTPHVRLCDSPGLVFPSLVPKPLQILSGIYPIAQVREPFTAVGFLSERLNLPKLLKLQHPSAVDDGCCSSPAWSAMNICEAWAIKRGFITSRMGRPDTFRAANNILRLALDGRICLCLRPPGFTKSKGEWERHPETAAVVEQQAALEAAKGAAVEEEVGLTIPDSDEEYDRMVSLNPDHDKDHNDADSHSSSSSLSDIDQPNIHHTNRFFLLPAE